MRPLGTARLYYHSTAVQYLRTERYDGMTYGVLGTGTRVLEYSTSTSTVFCFANDLFSIIIPGTVFQSSTGLSLKLEH
jgi:hypothetical protein